MTQVDLIDTPASTGPLLHLDPRDDVAVALRALTRGERFEVAGRQIEVREDIPNGHKVALCDMPAGETVRKFGWAIGELTAAVVAGGHVHTHNLRTQLSGVEGYSYAPAATEPLGMAETQSFDGYRRADGRVGTRNEIWILPTVGCVG
ncbi:MAG: UxaA family hydrolase, partial [Sphingomonas sp.]